MSEPNPLGVATPARPFFLFHVEPREASRMSEPHPLSVATCASPLPVPRGTTRGIAHEPATFV